MTKEKSSNNQNGKGDSPRNNTSNKFRNNYSQINWKKKDNRSIPYRKKINYDKTRS